MWLHVFTLLVSLILIEAKINKCGTALLDGCFCGEQFYESQTMFVVNCTGLNFNNTDMLRNLPEETQMIIFSGNKIPTLDINLFGDVDLSDLKIIDLSSNGIKEIRGKAFHHVLDVERLILNHNNISIADKTEKNFHHPRVFSGFTNLRELHLTNAFTDNTDDALAIDLHDIFLKSNLVMLYKLHLEQNEIVNFKDERVFCDLPALEQLYLGQNNINRLNFNVTCLKKLSYLDLEYNNITKFAQEDLEKFDQLAQPNRPQNLMLELENNPFRCDTAIRNLYAWLHRTNVKVRNIERLECHQAKYGQKYIMNLKNLAEAKHAKISKALMVLLVILVLILLTLLSAYIYLKKESVKGKLAPLFEAVSRKVQYTTIESQADI